MTLYFASSNEHKKEEMMRLLDEVTVRLPKEDGIDFNPDENGKSFIENALIKADALYEKVKSPVLADDSGLVVDALGGRPGIHTRRYGDTPERALAQKEKNAMLLSEMEGVKERSARFVCALVLMLSPERKFIIEETAEGFLATEPSGEHGFGYDPIFIMGDTGKSAAELSAHEKDMLSHRGKAVRKMNLLIRQLKKENEK